MKAVIYARYSSDKQTEQSIEGQLTVCRSYAEREGIEIVGEYIDRAISGRTDNRPDFQKMLADSAKKQWDAVIVYKGDRFARDRISSAIAKKTLRDNGVRLISATENIPDTPEGIILESLLEGMAEYYSAELSQKIRRGLEESRKKGNVTGGRVPIGYTIEGKKYIVSEEYAQTVRLIFELYISGKSASEISEALKADGRYQPSGKPISTTIIYRILQAEYYKGDAQHPQIVTLEMWDAAAKIHRTQQKTKTHPARSEFLGLIGKVFCGVCGEPYVAEAGHGNGGKYYYYRCASVKRKKNVCSSKAIRRETLETIVFDACCEVLESGFLRKVVDRAFAISEEKANKDAAVERLEGLLRDREQGIENIVSAIEQGIYTPATKARLETLENEASDLRERIRVEKSRKTVTKDDLLAFLSNLIESRTDDDDFRASVFSLLVRNVLIFPDRIRITFNYTPDGGKDIDIKDEIKTAIEEAERFDDVYKNTTNRNKVEPNAVFFTPYFFGIWVKR